jgi:hypothetical protein
MTRILSAIEQDSRFATVRREWAWSGYYWYPLQSTARRDVLAFDGALLEKSIPANALRELLIACGISNVFWFREHDLAEELAVDQLPSLYAASESFIVDEKLDWIVYWSHEGTITFGGRLLDQVKLLLPEWREMQCICGDDVDAL